jgi:hypothetical protein
VRNRLLETTQPFFCGCGGGTFFCKPTTTVLPRPARDECTRKKTQKPVGYCRRLMLERRNFDAADKKTKGMKKKKKKSTAKTSQQTTKDET